MEIELLVSVRNLPSIDPYAQFNASCTVYESRKKNWVNLGETEVYSDTAEIINYDFENSIILQEQALKS